MIPHMHFDVQFLEKFGVTFRREGETLALKCTLLVTPDLKRVQPRAEWYTGTVSVAASCALCAHRRRAWARTPASLG